MAIIHFLNVLEGDCNIIQHDSGRISVIDVSNAYNREDTPEEKAAKASREREERRTRTKVPSNKIDYRQKLTPDNPIEYLKQNIGTNEIFRFIISHPDMDHLDGIKDLYTEFTILNTWDTENNKYIGPNESFAGYNQEDWKFYTQVRAGQLSNTRRLTNYDNDSSQYWNNDRIKILCPSKNLVSSANTNKDYNDASYVLLFSFPRLGNKYWRVVFAGDSDDHSWAHILKNYSADIKNIDVLFAPHHGRDSNRNYDFLKVLTPTVTLLGNASSNHLAYQCYPPTRITNNQAGYVVIEVLPERMSFYVKNYDFARDFKSRRNWSEPQYYPSFKAYDLFRLNA